MNSVLEQKQALREHIQRMVAELPGEVRRVSSAKICERLLALPETRSAATIFCFVSRAGEVDTHALIDTLQRQGKTLLVPRILTDARMIAVAFGAWSDLRPGSMGILSPVSTEEYTGRVDACVTPGLGFSTRGQRLGYGRGYYDHWFRSHVVSCRIGLAFECQLRPDLPVTVNDVSLDVLVTERRVIRVG